MSDYELSDNGSPRRGVSSQTRLSCGCIVASWSDPDSSFTRDITRSYCLMHAPSPEPKTARRK